MLSKLYTATLLGLDCRIVEVEVDYRKGTNFFSIVGLAGRSIQEAKDRIPSAIKNSGASFIPMQIIMNLAPAELNKSGPSYDLPLAVGYLIASDQIKINTEKKLFIGELALDGRLRPVQGILPIVDHAKHLGFEEIYIPSENGDEASLVDEIKVFPVENLKQLIDHFQDKYKIIPKAKNLNSEIITTYDYDLSQVKGQQHAKRALEISAAGGHNILFSGVPGSGKTLISKCLPSILPDMTLEESLEVTRIYSVAGMTLKDQPLIQRRPFRSPHHTSSQVALVGGGAMPKPGEISLAHRGVLFLDEFPEFSSQSLEALRQPLEDKVVTISRASAALTFPAGFTLVAAMNPCRCGYRGDPIKQCTCTVIEVSNYQKRISGPILDRFDLQINVPKVKNSQLFKQKEGESSTLVKERVKKARDIQLKRFKGKNIFSNSEINQKDIMEYMVLDLDSRNLLNDAVRNLNLTARAYFRILRVARTIADLRSSENVEEMHVAEAISYRVDLI